MRENFFQFSFLNVSIYEHIELRANNACSINSYDDVTTKIIFNSKKYPLPVETRKKWQNVGVIYTESLEAILCIWTMTDTNAPLLSL